VLATRLGWPENRNAMLIRALSACLNTGLGERWRCAPWAGETDQRCNGG
jgi:hypothetical protein